MAEKSSCVIVGRGADYILREENPFRLFVYSDMQSKLSRCRKNESSDYEAGVSVSLSDKELTKRIAHIDKSRADYYEFYTGQKWGARENYDLCINTARYSSIKSLAEAVAKIYSC